MSEPLRFISTRGGGPGVVFSEAMEKGLAGDGGLFVPEQIPTLPESFWSEIHKKSLIEIGQEIASCYVSSEEEKLLLRGVVQDAITFDAPLVQLREHLFVLELFHGPTLAFKDFGARFMARAFAALNRKEQSGDLLILVATSGDTGSAVANGFYGVPGINVCLLYPSGKVSRLQEQQMTTLGGNVTALEVEGTFDDCQRLVKEAFSDPELSQKVTMSSANSINIARLLPQSFYYAYATGQLKQAGIDTPPLFSVPSGNFGNLTAGLIAKLMGMPTRGFLAATNANAIIPRYLDSGVFEPAPSIETISNAMDVGNPSNFERMLHLFNNSHEEIRTMIHGSSYSDADTRSMIEKLYRETGYTADPHTAVGVLAAEAWQKDHGSEEEGPVIVLSTAHPAKFGDIVEQETGQPVEIPRRLKACMDREKRSIPVSADFRRFRQFLIEQWG